MTCFPPVFKFVTYDTAELSNGGGVFKIYIRQSFISGDILLFINEKVDRSVWHFG